MLHLSSVPRKPFPMESNPMKLFSFASAVCLPVLLFLSAPVFAQDAPNTPPAQDAPERRVIPPLTLEERIVDLIEAIQDEAPETYRRMADLPREEALARVMRALDSGAVLVSGIGKNGKTDAAVQDAEVKNYPALMLTGKKFLYLRFDGLTALTVPEAVKALDERGGNADASGVIFDLRNAIYGDYGFEESLAESARKLKCPVMVLISGKTKGAGELLAAVLRRDCGAVLIGTETAGSVFPVKRITVNDVAWFVPNPPARYSGISPYALKPDLEKTSEARLDYDRLKESPDKLDGDPVLRLAADLLTMKAAVKPVEPSRSPAQ